MRIRCPISGTTMSMSADGPVTAKAAATSAASNEAW